MAGEVVKGKVTDRKTGEPLAYANVYVSDSKGSPITGKGTTTGLDGSFTVGIDSGEYLTASYVGYDRDTVAVRKMSCTTQGVAGLCSHDFKMRSGIALPEVVISPTWWQKNWKKVALWGGLVTGVAVLTTIAYKKKWI